CSLLIASLDLARRQLVADAGASIGRSLAAAARLRDLIAAGGRFDDAGPAMLASPDVVALDPLHVVIETRSGGISGHDARAMLLRDHAVHVEMATDD
ncbi:hypothetical protein ABTF72_18730, partial [Acinetobacter baumannii]